MALTSLGPGDYLEALTAVSRVLDSHAAALDRLHREPSADGQSALSVAPGAGTDLAATIEAARRAADGCRDFASLSAALADGGRGAATGRAGRNIVTVFSGMAEVLCNIDRLDGPRLALSLESAAERFAPADTGADPGGFAAVLTVVADSALSAADDGAELAEVILQAADAGLEELEHGPEANQRLAVRGVVDAAAAGLLLMLDTLASVVTGEPLPSPPGLSTEPAATAHARPATLYRVGCRFEPDRNDVEGLVDLEDELAGLGILELDATVSPWRVVVHTVLPGTAVEVLIGHGIPREIDIQALDVASSAVRVTGRAPESLAGAAG